MMVTNRCWLKVPGIRFEVFLPIMVPMLALIGVLLVMRPMDGVIMLAAYMGGLMLQYLSGE
jgi:energy-converting hydrogenase Eha subunit C